MARDDATSQLTQSYSDIIRKIYFRARDKLYNWRHLAWLILFVAASNVICIGGKRRAFGIFIAALHTAYNETSMTELNWIGDSYAALGFFLMPFATTLIIFLNRPYRSTMFMAGVTIFTSCLTSAAVPSPGFLFITHTIFHGIGSTLVLCGTSLVTGEYFDKTHRFHVLATAFVSGGPYGVLLFGPLFSHWIQHYGWREAFVYSGVLFLFVNWMGTITFIPRTILDYEQDILTDDETDEMGQSGEIKLSNSGDRKKSEKLQPSVPTTSILLRNAPKASDGRGWAFCSWTHIKNNPQVFLWGFERLIHNIVVYGLMMNLTTYVTHILNNELIQGARVNLYFGLGESLIFTVGALIGDKIRGHLAFTYLIGAIFAAVFLYIIQTTYTNLTVVYVLAGFVGAAVGVGNTFLYATAEEVMLVHGSIAFPMTKMVAGIGMLIAPLFSGAVIDVYGYRGFFISMAIMVTLRVILLVFVCFILRRKLKMALQDEMQQARTEGKYYAEPCSFNEHPICPKPSDHDGINQQISERSFKRQTQLEQTVP